MMILEIIILRWRKRKMIGKDIRFSQIDVIVCPVCFCRHGIPVPENIEEYGGCDITCGCGKNIILLANFENYNEFKHEVKNNEL